MGGGSRRPVVQYLMFSVQNVTFIIVFCKGRALYYVSKNPFKAGHKHLCYSELYLTVSVSYTCMLKKIVLKWRTSYETNISYGNIDILKTGGVDTQ